MTIHFRSKLIFLTILITFAFGFLTKFTEAEMIILDRIYLIVNSQMITRSEAQDFSKSLKSQISSPKNKENKFQKILLTNLIQELLLLDRAKALKVSPSIKDINRKLDQLSKNQPQLLEIYSEEKLKEQIAREFKKQRVISREVDSKIHLDTDEIILFCKKQIRKNRKIGLAQILLQGSDEDIRVKVNNIIKEFNNGKLFEELAKQYSADLKAKLTGGKLGIYKIEDLLPEIGMVAKDLEPGKISEVVKTSFGKHLLYIYKEIFPKDEQCNNINSENDSKYRNLLYVQKRKSILEIYLNDLLSCSDIKILDPGNSGLPNSNYLPVSKKREINCLDRRTMILPQKAKKNKTNRKP